MKKLKILKSSLLALSMAASPIAFSDLASDSFKKGLEAHNQADFRSAYNLWLRSAEKGSSDAQYGLAELYYKGEGVSQSYREAAKWYHLAAENGSADALYKLGLMYGNGEGVALDQEKAMMLLRKSAELGNADAQVYQGLIFLLVDDKAEAYKWLLSSARQGNQAAQKGLDALCKESPWVCVTDNVKLTH